MQLLLYSSTLSPRLQYICQVIFKEIMLVDFFITNDLVEFNHYTGAKIYYGNEVGGGHLTIGNCGLLFENTIKEQLIQCFDTGKYKAFFKTDYKDFPFDILSASFYLLSRYEEYGSHEKDIYGRYAHENSLAFKENFLHQPLVNIWINHLKEVIQHKFPQLTMPPASFSFLPTYDIDIAFSYRHKGLVRNLGGFLKSPSFDRIKVLLGLAADPFDAYDWLNKLHRHYNLQPMYFFLLAKENSTYDKNISPDKKSMWKLIQQHAKKYEIGIHPSWQTGDQPALLQTEKQQLEAMMNAPVTKSRQHYIRFNLPGGYRQLIEVGIRDEYSMGYGSINGFRASAASSFFWYDLQKEETTTLRIHPFCFMDANAFYEQKYTWAQANTELLHYYTICKEVNGQLITIWHNNFLGTDPQFAGWSVFYKQFVIRLKTMGWNLTANKP
ncbi:MAG: hypothetical protein JWP81_57 [Ferruginibacter sp.]|nr:hypothetical protein [Ferruginibacter sp.]